MCSALRSFIQVEGEEKSWMAVWLAGGGGDHHHDAVHIRVETHHLDLHLQRGSRGSPCLQNLSGINLVRLSFLHRLWRSTIVELQNTASCCAFP